MSPVTLDDGTGVTPQAEPHTPKRRTAGNDASPLNINKLRMKLGRTQPNNTPHHKANLKSPRLNGHDSGSRPTSPDRTAGPSGPSNHSRGNVLARLQALFPSHPAHSNTPMKTAPLPSEPPIIPHPNIPRLDISLPVDSPCMPTPRTRSPNPRKTSPQPLKVRIVTWNHGYSLPKGDLETLLGRVPLYEAPAANSDRTTLPTFPLDSAHPYHIIVVAGQECPSQSKMPLGLGAGFKMELRDKERKLEREKSKKEKERARPEALDKQENWRKSEERPAEPESIPNPGDRSPPPNVPLVVLPPPGTPPPARTKLPSLHSFKSASTPNILSTSAALSSTPQPAGWSMMLEDWFVNGSQRVQEERPIHLSSASAVALGSSAPPTPYLNTQSTPISSSISAPTTIKPSGMSSPSRPPSLDSSQSSVNQDPTENHGAENSAPPSHTPTTKGQKAPYELLIKERLMGIYIAIFVHRDVRHLVQGVSKSSVKAGLIGGRVGNKGGIGISMKVAGVSLLFINAHLAAHEGRNEARLANWAKIKAELNVDTFLKPNDPRALAEDITDRFDHTFLFGDLNFRLNVTRLHAEWLVARKDYATALEFDQLHSVMKETHAFDGFSEATIDFPPTFKYDVMRTLKKHRSVRAAIAGKASKRLRSSKVALAEENALSEAEETEHRASVSEDSDSEEGEHEAQSMLSYGWKSGHSKYTTDNDATDDSENELDELLLPAAQNTVANLSLQQPGIQHKILSAPVTQKAKAKFMALVNHSRPTTPSRSTSPRPSSPTKTTTELRPPLPAVIIRSKSDINPSTSPINKTAFATQEVTPGSPLLGKPVSLHRAHSTKSAPIRSKDADELNVDDDRGVYDSSSKQRVPSWCDRILFKSTVVPEPESKEVPREPRNLANRMSQLFSTHLKRPRKDSAMSNSSGEGGNNFHGDPAPPVLQALPSDNVFLSSPPKDEVKAMQFGRFLGPHCPLNKATTTFERSISLTLTIPPGDPTLSTQPATTVNGRRKSFSSSILPTDSPIEPIPPKLTTSPTFPLAPNSRTSATPFSDNITSVPTTTQPSQGRKWFFGFPSILQPKETLTPLPPPQEVHRRGDTVCLNYNTLDDRQMRKLEGRSDHRPVIGSYAIYI